MTRSKVGIGVAVAVALAVVVALGLALLRGGDDEPVAAQSRPSPSPTATSSASPSPTEEPTPEPTPEATAAGCEGPDTLFNVEGVRQDSLLPDCGVPVVTREEEQRSGLGLGCGGRHPIILFKTTTEGARTSVCGRNASGEQFRVVVQPDGEEVLDMPGRYDPDNDAFIGEDGDTQYAVIGYTGDLVVTGPDGVSRTQASDGDWISLDNEPDGD